jgi:hypothetical protein
MPPTEKAQGESQSVSLSLFLQFNEKFCPFEIGCLWLSTKQSNADVL